MSRALDDLDSRIDGLLSDPSLVGHPAREALFELRERLVAQLTRIERITPCPRPTRRWCATVK